MNKKQLLTLVLGITTSGIMQGDAQWGGHGGAFTSYKCDSGTYVVKIFGRAGSYIDQVGMICSNGKKLGPVGWSIQKAVNSGCKGGGCPFGYENAQGFSGIKGRAGDYIDQLEPINYDGTSASAVGGSGGSPQASMGQPGLKAGSVDPNDPDSKLDHDVPAEKLVGFTNKNGCLVDNIGFYFDNK